MSKGDCYLKNEPIDNKKSMNENTFKCYAESNEIRKSGDHTSAPERWVGGAVSKNHSEVPTHIGRMASSKSLQMLTNAGEGLEIRQASHCC